MKIYEVGGAVRDCLLGKQPHDIDYLVIGATPEELSALGFIQIGKSFPVFINPYTKDEYALARKEIKIGKKHTDFMFDFSPDITLEEDLERRDFTCNALARELESGKIIDIFGGINDIKNKILRHINSEHFIEDPLRILRLCRFSAQLDFDIAPETLALAKNMVKAGMLENLSKERIREELIKSLQSNNFERAIQAMENCDALTFLFKDLSKIFENQTSRKQLYKGLSACNNLRAEAKFAILMNPIGDEFKISENCKMIGIPLKFKEFALTFFKYEHHLSTNYFAEDDFLFDMLKNTGRLKDMHQANLMFKILNCLGYKQDYNLKRSQIILKICNDNRVNSMPDFKNIPKNATISQKYKKYILQKLSDVK